MSNKFFEKFPTTTYANTSVVNVMRRVVLGNNVRRSPEFFYKMTMEEGLRERVLSDSYYQDADFDWLIYLSNSIIDPYYGWYQTTDEFNEYLKEKYGSLEEAYQRVSYYRVHWADDDQELSPSFFENTLDGDLRKYYEPVFDKNARIVSYRRARREWTMNTNKVVRFTVANGTFTDERIKIKSVANNEVVGTAEVIASNTTTVTVQHVSGNTSATVNYLYGVNSAANCVITTTEELYENIPADEFVYWAPVYVFDDENERNEANKNVRLLLDTAVIPISSQVEQSLRR